MHIPAATYRLQFTPSFNFKEALGVVAYLSRLGISDIYASPIFKACRGSDHGYDVVDPNEINPELGGEEGFNNLLAELRNQKMCCLQDIVPNHMAYDRENAMLMDVLENGSCSPYFNFFDIEWNHFYEDIRGRLLAPFLGRFYGETLEDGEIRLQYDAAGFSINYYELKLPLRIESYPEILNYDLDSLERHLGKNHPDLIKYIGIIYSLSSLPCADKVAERYDHIKLAKSMLWELYQGSAEIQAFLGRNVETFNGRKGDPQSFNLLDNLLSRELFRLSFWKVANEEINYRRFFNINKLISLRVEDNAVFDHTHGLIFKLLAEGKIGGLRVDHVDGLYDPAHYLIRLKEKAPQTYLLVEKILEFKERLPGEWPVHGTTGYDFLNYVNGIFLDWRNERKFNRMYFKFTGFKSSYGDLVGEKKKFIIGNHMAGDIDNLAHIIKRVSGLDRYGRDITLYGLKKALVEVMASFTVYRTYIRAWDVGKTDTAYILEAVGAARRRNPGLLYELNFVEKFLLMEFAALLSDEEKQLVLNFVMRWQQYTGPLMAKGVEDTFFYVYNRFISLNDVGGNPGKFGMPLKEFHTFNKRRLKYNPHTLNATSTHDAKRGEDVRARLGVLSEIPKEWDAQVKKWKKINKDKKTVLNGLRSPDDNDEYFFYQTLVGAWPFSEAQHKDFAARIKDYIIKAVREAKVHTAWIKPDSEYENAYSSFAESVLHPEGNSFLAEFLPFQKRVAYFGVFNSLSQALVKVTSPGVPDFYQGSELWDLNLVDPDNRRPVDFTKRTAYLADMEARQHDLHGLISEILPARADGRVKLFTIFKSLQTRRAKGALFEKGDYLPVEVKGKYKVNVAAFARSFEGDWVITVVPRFLSALIKEGELPLGEKVWGDTHLVLTEDMPRRFKDIMTENNIEVSENLPLGKIFTHFPVVLLIRD